MALLDTKLWRDLWSVRGRVLALVLILGSGVAIQFAIASALHDLRATQDSLVRQLHTADLEVQVEPVPTADLPDARALAEVADVESRLLLPASLELTDGTSLAGELVFQPAQPRMNQWKLLDGRVFAPGADEVVVDRSLAEHQGLRVGDHLTVAAFGRQWTPAVVGIGTSAEFMVTTVNPDYVVAEPGSLGVLWADPGRAADITGAVLADSLLVRLAPGADPSAVGLRLSRQLESAGVGVVSVTPRLDGYSYRSVRDDLNAFAAYSPAIVLTLVGLSIVLGILTFHRFAVDKRREFGIIAALGYRRRRVRFALVRLGLVIGVLGGVVGLILGIGVGWAFAEVYASGMELRDVTHSVDPALAAVAVAMGIAAGAVTLLVASIPTLATPPRQLLSPVPAVRRAPGRGRTLLRLPLAVRHGLRGLTRARLLTLTSILAMAGSVAVAISYGLGMTSTLETVNGAFRDERWRYAVDLRQPQPESQARAAIDGPGLAAAEPYQRTTGELRAGDRAAPALLVGLTSPQGMHLVIPARGHAATAADEVVLSDDLAGQLGVGLGDEISAAKGRATQRVRVVGITNDIYLRQATLTLPALQRLGTVPDAVSGFYVDAGPDYADALRTQTATIARVTSKDSITSAFETSIAEMMSIIYIAIGFSVGVSILFVTTLVHIQIVEQRGEFAIMRSLGLSGRRIRTVIMTGVIAQLVASLVLSVPLAFGLARYLNDRMGQAWFAVDVHVGWSDFAWPMLAAVVVAPVVGLLGQRAVMRWGIADHLRTRST
ncbi:ABC transporter permease [Parafrankia elaeagni]|uniref:ABC transporter permease n=1 Tax=Parafrankia elaeagni TaxID=222534 RepID=UPI0003759DEB|nr:FtsX-like permease family protein [Parafrankia elaeagni]